MNELELNNQIDVNELADELSDEALDRDLAHACGGCVTVPCR